MAEDWVETTLHELERWAKRRDEQVDMSDLRILLEVAAETLGLGAPGALTPAGLETLLLREFPAVVTLEPEDVPPVLAAGRALVDFLEESGAVAPDGAERLRAELTRIEPEFATVAARMGDLGREESAADLLAGLMRDDGVDVADDDAVQRWAEEFNALPEEERAARVSEHLADLENLVVRPVRQAPPEQLAAQARSSGLTADVRELAAWAGGRELTEAGELTPEDAAAAVEALGLGIPRSGEPEAELGADLDADLDAADHSGPAWLARLWRAAVAAGTLVAGDGAVRPGPALETFVHGADEAVLAAWLAAFEVVVTLDADPEQDLNPFEVVRKDLPGVLIHLYEQDEPATRDELFEILFEHIEDSYEFSDGDLLKLAGRYALDLEIEALEGWEVVHLDERGGHALTPLGMWGVRELLLADGYLAPLVGDLAEAPAAEFLDGLVLHGEDTADEEIGLWLARRDPAEAAAELLAVMRDGAPGARNLAAAVLHGAGPAAEGAVRQALGDARTRPYAALWLHANGDDTVELSPDEMMWIFTDTLAGLLETAEPDEAVAAALADAPPEADLGAMIAEMWRVDHPDIAPVLDVLGAHHPDRAVAKAARTSAFKARSRF